MAQQVTNMISIYEDEGSKSGLDHWGKDLMLLQAALQAADATHIPCCCGCGVGWQLQL